MFKATAVPSVEICSRHVIAIQACHGVNSLNRIQSPVLTL